MPQDTKGAQALCLPPASVGEGRAPKPGLAGPCLASRSPSTAPPASPLSCLQPVTDRAEQMAPNTSAGSGLISVLVTGQGTSINRGLRWPLCNPGIPSLQMRKLRPQSSVSNPVIRRLGFQTRLLLLTGFLWGSPWVPGGKSGTRGQEGSGSRVLSLDRALHSHAGGQGARDVARGPAGRHRARGRGWGAFPDQSPRGATKRPVCCPAL